MSGPRVVNRHHFPDGVPPPSMYIGRGTPLGNPYTVKDHGPELAMSKYREWIWGKLSVKDPAVLGELAKITEEHKLICSCKPGPCHGDVVVAAWQWLRKQQREDADEAANETRFEREALADERYH